MLTCTFCGAPNAPSAWSCSACGSSLHAPGAGSTPPPSTAPPPPPPSSVPPPAPGMVGAQGPVFFPGAPPQYPQPGYPPYGQQPYPGYGTPQFGYGYGPPPNNGLATASLVTSLVSLVVCGVGALVALPLGFVALSQIKNSGGRQGGRGMAIAGIVISGIQIALGLFFILLVVASSPN